MEDPSLHGRASFSQRRDVRFALLLYRYIITGRPQDEVLNVGCGCGDLTNGILAEYLESFKKIVGTDTSEKSLSYARASNSRNSIYYVSLDITWGYPVKNLPSCDQIFDKIFCFSCLSWIRDLDQALENVRYLLKTNGECFFSFVGSSPVYNTYSKLSENPRWAKYMKDHPFVIPFTHFIEEPAVQFAERMTTVGLEVPRSRTTIIRTPKHSLELLKEHVSDVNHFTSRIPSHEKSDFVDDCLKEVLSALRREDFLTYKLVTAYGRNPSALPRSENLNAEQEPGTNDTDEDFCFIKSSDVQTTSNGKGQVCEQTSDLNPSWCTVS